MDSLGRLPHDCLSHLLSLTSAADTCRSATLSTAFRLAANSDEIWEKFLPPDYRNVLSRAAEDPFVSSSKKQLFLRLYQQPLLIDGGKMSFMLETSTGKKCLMISAREMSITRGGTPLFWRMIPLHESRFQEVAELLETRWLEMNGELDTKELTPSTIYIVYLVFNLSPIACGFGYPCQKASVVLGDEEVSNQFISLETENPARRSLSCNVSSDLGLADHYPVARGDGWMEVALGEFVVDENGSDGFVRVRISEREGGHWKTGLFVDGIEFRSKK